MELGKCLSCKTVFSFKPSQQAGKYCCNACQHEYQQKQLFAKIRTLGKKPKGVGTIPMKNFLIATRGHKCKLCKLTHWRNQPMPLVLDHIDGNADNWKLTNLRLICNNCDSLTATYKGRNRGNGRHIRRLRYENAQSY